ncbi:MAG: hypothetical protein RIQ71_1699 [Verrucomicrobiota bacterium]|jgi:hypothetical protein
MFSIFRKLVGDKVTLDLRGEVEDPVEGWRRAAGGPFLIDVPAAKLRVLDFWGGDPHNPFIVTLQEYAAGRCMEYKGSPLENFYHCWQPFSGENAGDAGSPWRQVRAQSKNTAEGRLKRHEFREIARELGVAPGEIHGHIKGGPVSQAFGEITFRRLARLYDSISRDGFRPESSAARYPTGFCFAHEGDHRVSIGSGKHRVTVMLALGWQKIPVELGPPKLPVVIRREEVDRWPNVRSGRYSRDEALGLFDEMFRRQHPSGWKKAGD